MITCSQCGGQNLPGMAYCENCGAPLSQQGTPGGASPTAPSASAAAPGLVTAEDPASIALPQPVMPADQPPAGPDIPMSSPAGANGVMVEPSNTETVAEPKAPGTADLPQLGAQQPQAQARMSTLTLTFPTGQTFSMQGDEASVGRADVAQNWRPEVDVIPFGGGAPDLGVSRHHARLARLAGGFAVTDMGSTNGTYVNGHATPYNQPVPLNNGDTLSFGALNTQVSIS